MSIESNHIEELLTNHFSHLAEPQLQRDIATHGRLYTFKAGEVIMNYGSYIKLVPLIISGSIKVTREDDTVGREILLYFLGPGETCSMSFTCCMMNKQSAIRTEALEDTELIGVPIRYVDQWLTTYQSWKNFVMQTYDTKMVELVKVLDSIAFEGMDLRLWKYLQSRATATRSSQITVTHQEIASDLGASREAISRLLKKLESQGRVVLGRNSINLKGV